MLKTIKIRKIDMKPKGKLHFWQLIEINIKKVSNNTFSLPAVAKEKLFNGEDNPDSVHIVMPRSHIADIYEKRFEIARLQGKSFLGLAQVVRRLKQTRYKNIQVATFGDLLVFSNEKLDDVLGVVWFGS